MANKTDGRREYVSCDVFYRTVDSTLQNVPTFHGITNVTPQNTTSTMAPTTDVMDHMTKSVDILHGHVTTSFAYGLAHTIPVLIVLAVIGNTLIIVTMNRKRNNDLASSTLFTALAVWDTQIVIQVNDLYLLHVLPVSETRHS